MAYLGKLIWWESALAAIEDWDETEDTLSKMVTLPNANYGQSVSLDEIFFRALNYVYYHQTNQISKPQSLITSISDRLNHLSIVDANEEEGAIELVKELSLLSSAEKHVEAFAYLFYFDQAAFRHLYNAMFNSSWLPHFLNCLATNKDVAHQLTTMLIDDYNAMRNFDIMTFFLLCSKNVLEAMSATEKG